ncbi:MAG: hypothetical protein A2Z97_10855, partial [Bdellovibrionales bacterium GWB1_52_6]
GDEIISLICEETGKPRFEALSSEVLPALEHLTFLAKSSKQILSDQPLPIRLFPHRRSDLNYTPLGVVAVIAPWNFPFFIPFSDVISAVVAGNSVIVKPSEVTPRTGLKIQELCDEAGLPAGLVQIISGDASAARAIIEHKPAKIFFTGSVGAGKEILSQASKHLIPVNLELGGKNALIVMRDADLDLATSAALWGGFSNAGQVCAATSRILVHDSVASEFTELLLKKAALLQAHPEENRPGRMISEKQITVYQSHLADARQRGLSILMGGEFSSDLRSLAPTLISGAGIEESLVFQEESFGPIIALSQFKTPAEAVAACNRSALGLVASVFTRNLSQGRQIAKQLQVGTVMINEVVYAAGLAEAPWGGIKESGMGRTRGELGLHSFVNTRHIHRPRSRLFSFKSHWWFPYTPFQYNTFRYLAELYRRHWTDKLKAFPHFLVNLVHLLKREKRI